ncbi:MAG: relaxase/mobilization nuclease domain-containing protein [Cellvibrio sp.]|uniref:relaxase/mobilization nuclease domain-containing protein n=1 Tax=Cellvibrio sp. TaxID=1965322 RepID=UPI0027196B9A|nr:relaxase/mobilization nuclease domain-containing protein [Cellvibrio sp.]
MIVKKTRNKKAGSTKAARVAGVANYIVEPQRENGVEKCIHHEAENFLTDTHGGHVAEMIALAQDAVRSKDPIDHWILSWAPNERPTVDQVREAVKMFVGHCGLTGHQVIWGLHDDTKNLHVHIAVNRVHPDTLKVIEINKGFQLNAAHQAVAIIEKKQGWKSVENARFKTDELGHLITDSKTKLPQVFKEADKKKEPTGPARDKEIQTGQKSAQRFGIENAAPIIANATSWKDLHTKMSAAGMQYQRKGSGAVVQVGDALVKASDVSRTASLSSLQKRFGPYKPLQEIKPNEYHHHTKESHPIAFGKEAGNGMRKLSECNLAVLANKGKTRRKGVLHIDARPGGRLVDGLRRTTGRDNSTGLTPQPMRQGQPGWNEYIAIRDAQKAAKTHDTIELQKRHGDERAALLAKLKAERTERFSGDRKGKGDARNALQSITATLQAAEKLELQEQQRDERKALQAKYKPLPIYKVWKDQPQIVGLHVLPVTERSIATSTVASTLRALTSTVDARKHITYQLGKRDVFRDEGRTIAILDLKSDAGIAAALATAQQKFGNVLTLTGSDEFKENAVAVAVVNGLTCKFADPALDALRERLQAEKYQAQRQASRILEKAAEPILIPSNKSAKRGIKMPVLVPEVIELPEVVSEVIPTAAQWVAMQLRQVDEPYSKGAADFQFNILYVSLDGVVVEHGRGIATYPIPTDLALQVGDRVVIDSNGALCLPRVPEPGKEKGKGIG